jgi:multiple sugar transport system ATP-binding protein
VLQQADTPAVVYDRPANLFVAGFVGSPPMNLVHATIDGGDGSLVARLGALTVPIPAAVAGERGLAEWAGKRLIVGIRPEDLHGPDGAAPDGKPTLTATVDRVEALGASLLAYFRVEAEQAKTESVAAATGGALEDAPLIHNAGALFCAAFEPRSGIRAGDTVEVRLDPERLHFFDPATEQAV